MQKAKGSPSFTTLRTMSSGEPELNYIDVECSDYESG
jgi:hypothetical protein